MGYTTCYSLPYGDGDAVNYRPLHELDRTGRCTPAVWFGMETIYVADTRNGFASLYEPDCASEQHQQQRRLRAMVTSLTPLVIAILCLRSLATMPLNRLATCYSFVSLDRSSTPHALLPVSTNQADQGRLFYHEQVHQLRCVRYYSRARFCEMKNRPDTGAALAE